MDISRLYIYLLFFVISCTQKTTFSHSLSKDQWNYNDTIIFTHNIDDIENTYRMALFFRNTMNYSFQNIYHVNKIIHNHKNYYQNYYIK